MIRLMILVGCVVGLGPVTACKRQAAAPATDAVPASGPSAPQGASTATAKRAASDDGHAADHGHSHGPGEDHAAGHGHDAAPAAQDDHATVDLGTVTIGDLAVAFRQGHGALAAGQESHLVVKLPYSDKGSTVVRAWIGTADRTLSRVGKATYSSAQDDYNVHAMAPDPLPDGVMWWVEIVRPDGAKVVGSVTPQLDG